MTLDSLSAAVHRFLKVGRKFTLEAASLVRGNRFYCRALNGDSFYNISINSDMSVSCNCQDYDGSGKIGDLSRESMEQIFAGERASSFRLQLSLGRLPILTCTRCFDLAKTTREKAAGHTRDYRLPHKGIMVENTLHCNLNCLACSRDDVMKNRQKKSLTLSDIREISLLIKQEQIEKLYYFNLGEPFISPSICEELEILRGDNPALQIILSTNGMLLDTVRKREAALLLDHIHFSIDGPSESVVRKYQRNSSFEKAYKNMRDMVRLRDGRGLSKPVIDWKYVLFNWNDKKKTVDRAVTLAREAGVDTISFWPTKSPFYGISWRYYLWGQAGRIGRKEWRHREVKLREWGKEAPASPVKVT